MNDNQPPWPTAGEHGGAPAPTASTGWDRAEILLAAGAFAVLCIAVLSFAPYLAEPDDYAYRASIIAMTHGHFLTLSTAQARALGVVPSAQHRGAGPRVLSQWVRLRGGRWISEKDPGYPFLAAPFQWLGIIRWAPLFYGALGCLGLFFGARRWLGRPGGAVAVGLYCSSGAALLFAWRDYMPTFTDASLIAAGTGALMWAVLAADAASRRRTWAGLAGFVALEAATFVRYTDIVVLGCAVAAILATRGPARGRLPRGARWWWLGSVLAFGAGTGLFDDLVYGGPLKSGYRPGEIAFSLSAVLPNFRYLPAHLIQAMPVLVPGLAAVAWITARHLLLRRADGKPAARARRDFAVGMALAASWFAIWGVYAAYTWTAVPGGDTLQITRFYVPAIGAIALLGAWLVTRIPGRAPMAALTSAAVVTTAMFGLGIWSFTTMRESRPPGMAHHQTSASGAVPHASGQNGPPGAARANNSGAPAGRPAGAPPQPPGKPAPHQRQNRCKDAGPLTDERQLPPPTESGDLHAPGGMT